MLPWPASGKVTVAVSLDGFKNTHNKMRNSTRSYRKALDTLRVLQYLKHEYKGRLNITINTMISPDNVDEIVEFAEEMCYAGFNLDYHDFEIQRNTVGLHLLPEFKSKLREVYKGLLEIVKKYYPSDYLATKNRFDIQFQMTMGYRHRWKFPCLAGKRCVVVYPDGDLSVCEARDAKINMSAFNYDLKKKSVGFNSLPRLLF